MKRILFLLAALSVCWPSSSQEADADGNHAVLNIVPRAEYSPLFYSGGGVEHDFGATSLYSFFDGNITENISFSVSNHWLSMKPGELYRNSFRSDACTWCDWAYLDFAIQGWNFDLGKQCTFIGGYGSSPCDVDTFWQLSSSIWNCYVTYQWGATVGYTIPSEMSSFSVQVLSSPYGERPFASGLYTFAGQWNGSFGPFSTLWQFAAVGTGPKSFDTVLSLGQKLELDKFSAELDYFTTFGKRIDVCAANALRGCFRYRPIYHVEMMAVCNWEPDGQAVMGTNIGGGLFFYIPGRTGEDRCRIHVNGGSFLGTSETFLNVGLTFFFPIHIC